MLQELQDEIEKHSISDQYAILRKVKSRERDKARAKVNRLFERKNPKIKKVCQVCGSKEKIEFHHIDYSKPYVINILCKNCHTEYHRGNIKVPNTIDLEKFCDQIIDKKRQRVEYKRQWLKELWLTKGYKSSLEVAKECKISSTYIERLARTFDSPSIRVAMKIGEVLDFDYNKLLQKK